MFERMSRSLFLLVCIGVATFVSAEFKVAFTPIFPSTHSLGALNSRAMSSGRFVGCNSRKPPSILQTECILGANINLRDVLNKKLFGSSQDVQRISEQSEEYGLLNGGRRSADDLIVEILCDAGDVAGFVVGGIWNTVKSKKVHWSTQLDAPDTLEADARSDLVDLAPSASWEYALVQQMESGSDTPSASPWRIVAPGCSQLPCDSAESAVEERVRLKSLREALLRHGTVSLVENGSYYLGMKHAQGKKSVLNEESSQTAVPELQRQVGNLANSLVTPVTQSNFKEVGANVVGQLQSMLPTMGRMPNLRGIATAMKAENRK